MPQLYGRIMGLEESAAALRGLDASKERLLGSLLDALFFSGAGEVKDQARTDFHFGNSLSFSVNSPSEPSRRGAAAATDCELKTLTSLPHLAKISIFYISVFTFM